MQRNRMWILLILLMTAAPLMAGSFQVSPIPIRIKPGEKSATFRVTNEGAAPVTVQFSAVAWTQDAEGRDRFDETSEVVVFPAIAEVPAKGERMVRVGYRGPRNLTDERCFRITVEELPASTLSGPGVKMMVTVSLPLFVPPRTIKNSVDLGDLSFAHGVVAVPIRNSGNEHARVGRIQVLGLDADGHSPFGAEAAGWYVLPGATRSFSVPLKSNRCPEATTMKVEVEMAGRSLDGQLNVEPEQCATGQ